MDVTFTPSKSKLALTVAGCVAFVAAGVFMLTTGPTVLEAIFSVLSIVFFGGGGVLLIVKLARTKSVLILTPAGLHPISGGLVPWDDYDGVGVSTVAGTTIIGIRLRSYDSYIASLTPAQATLAARAGRAGKLFGAVSSPLIGRRHTGSEALANIPGDKEGLAGLLAWSRETSGGYDLSFSPMLFDRPAPQVMQAIADYQTLLGSTHPEDSGSH
jgi:hypothetical protein